MRRLESRPSNHGPGRACLLATFLVAMLTPGAAWAQLWAGYGSDPQHTCQSGVASQLPGKVLWHMPVDLNPPFSGNDLFIHYASPVITRKNTVIVTVRGTATNPDAFQFKAVRGSTGAALWTSPLTTDYVLPPHNWIPVCGPTLVSGGVQLAVPGAGGTVYLRAYPDRSTGVVSQVAFYGNTIYANHAAALKSSIFICTPITCDAQGNLYFGFAVPTASGVAGAPAAGGLARISSTGVGSFITAADASGDANMQKVVLNCAPALSNDGKTVYVAVNNGGYGYLVALDSQTLSKATAKRKLLKDPRTDRNTNAFIADDGSGTPTVGPDGDVYFGVLEDSLYDHHSRGWLLHFSGDLATTKTPGSFGWDDTAAIVPASAVPQYHGTSSYLVLTKYNDYSDSGVGGSGQNKLAILDPNDTMNDPISGNTALVMKEVITVLGPTPNVGQAGVREWCVNSAAVDTVNKCAVVNSEDGSMYRWDFTTNTLSAKVILAAATGEAYTPTVIGPDGAVYAINRAVLNCVVKK